MFFSHLLKEHVDRVLVGRRRQPGEELPTAEGAEDGDVVLVLLAQLDPGAAARLPDSPRPLPEVGGRLVHVPDGLAHLDPLQEVLEEGDAALAELLL